MLKNIQGEKEWHRVIGQRSDIRETFETLLNQPPSLQRIGFNAYQAEAGVAQTLCKRPTTCAKVDHVLCVTRLADQAGQVVVVVVCGLEGFEDVDA